MLAGLDRRESVEFVADLWSAKGWTTTVEGDRVIARRAAPAPETRVIVIHHGPGRFGGTGLPNVENEPVDILVDRAPAPESDQFAEEHRADHYHPDDVYDLLFFGISTHTALTLFRRYSNQVQPSNRGPWSRKAVKRAVLPVIGVLLLGTVVGALAFGGLGTAPTDQGDDPTGPVTAVPSQTPLSTIVSTRQQTVDSDSQEAATANLIPDGTVRRAESVSTRLGEDWPQAGYDAANTGTAPGVVGPALGPNSVVTRSLGAPIRSSPVVGEERVFVGTRDGVLYALDPSDLSVEWTRDIARSSMTAPVVEAGRVYYGGYEAGPSGRGSENTTGSKGGLVAVDASTGERIWVNRSMNLVFSSPVVVNGTVYVIDANDHAAAIDAETGRTRWTAPIGGPVVSSPAVANGVMYIGDLDGHVYALDARTGKPRWRYDAGPPVPSTPAISSGVVYLGDATGTLHALQSTTGRELWNASVVRNVSLSIGSPGKGILTSPAVASRTVYAATENGRIFAVNTEDGRLQWRLRPPSGAVATAPVVVDGRVYLGGGNGRLYALDPTTGDQHWTLTVGDRLSPPALSGGIIYLGSENGTVYAFEHTNEST